MITIWKDGFTFHAAHQLGQCEEVYGKCSNLHGHSYRMKVGIKGEIDIETGMIVNFSDISNIVKNEIIEKLDHTNLNESFNSHFEKYRFDAHHCDEITTCEVMVFAFKQVLKEIIKRKYSNVEEVYVELWETSSSYASV